MRVSLKSKILGAYLSIVLLMGGALYFSISQLNLATRRLSFLQAVYIPTLGKLNGLAGMSHLSQPLEVSQLKQARSMLHVTTRLNPTVFSQTLDDLLKSNTQWLRKHSPKKDDALWKRVHVQLTELYEAHEHYGHLLSEVLSQPVDVEAIELARQKTVDKLNHALRTLSLSIRNQLQLTIKEERQALLSTIILASITVIIALLLAWLLLRSLTPLGQLKETIVRYAQGDRRARVAINTRDEIAELAQEFNRMADTISARDQTILEQQERLRSSERMALVGLMASKISHEIRNPLNAISLNLEILAEEVSPKAKDRLSTLLYQVDRLNTVASHYLDLTKSSSRPSEHTSHMGQIILQTAELLRPECRQRGLTLALGTLENLPFEPIVNGPTYEWEQVLMNLCRNAMEALSAPGSFGIDLNVTQDEVQLIVWDQGPGIPEANLPRLQEPFFSTKPSGTGLGLSITQELIQKYRATLNIESRMGEGSRFCVTIPRKVPSHDTHA